MAIGAAVGFDDVVLVTLGTGIGGALAIGGTLVRGTNGFAGEPGHMCVDPTGPLCVCGRRGCWERFASGSGIAHAATLVGMAVPSTRGAEVVVAAARAGDPTAIGVLDGFARWLGIGIANLADVLDPELVVIGGGLVEIVDLFLDGARDAFDQQVLGGSVLRRTVIVPTVLGADSGAVGAALLH
jgi:glucokinase